MNTLIDIIENFKKKYHSRDWRVTIEQFIKLAPDFPNDVELASSIGEIVADIEKIIYHKDARK